MTEHHQIDPKHAEAMTKRYLDMLPFASNTEKCDKHQRGRAAGNVTINIFGLFPDCIRSFKIEDHCGEYFFEKK